MYYQSILYNFLYQIPNIAVLVFFILFYSRSKKIENFTSVNLILFFYIMSIFAINFQSLNLEIMPDQIKYINTYNAFKNNNFQFDFDEKLSFDVILFSKIIAYLPLGFNSSGQLFLPLINKLLISIILIHMLGKKIINFKIFILLLLVPSLAIHSSVALRECLIIFLIYFTIYNLAFKKYFKFFFFAILLFFIKKPFFIITFFILVIYFFIFLSSGQVSKFFNIKKKLIIFKVIVFFLFIFCSLKLLNDHNQFLIAIMRSAFIKNDLTAEFEILLKSELADKLIFLLEFARNIGYIDLRLSFKSLIYFYDFIFLLFLTYFFCTHCNLNFFKKKFYFITLFVSLILTYPLLVNHGTFFRWRLIIFSLIMFMILIFEKKKNLYDKSKTI